MSDKLLSTRHVRFVREFFKDGNATQAYIRAGYSSRGAQPSASRLLAQPHIATAVAAYRERLARALEAEIEGRIRAGRAELKAPNHRKSENREAPTPESPEPDPTAQHRERCEERCAACELALNHGKEEQRWLEWELEETRAALTEARATIDAAGIAVAAGPPDPRRSAPPHGKP